MHLVSTSSHSPLAVFEHFEDAEAYLCSTESVSLRHSCIEPTKHSPTVHRVYVEAYPGYPEKTLGYIRSGVVINPDYNVR